MKYGFLKTLSVATIATMAVISCTKEKEEKTVDPVVEIICDSEFDADNSIELTLVLSASSKSDVVASLALATSPDNLESLIPASNLTFPEKVTIPAGSPAASFKISVDPTGLADGTYSVGIAVISATGATVSNDKSTIYVSLTVTNPVTTGLQANWTGTTDGEIIEYYGDYYVCFSLDVPGIKYFYAELNSDEDLDYYYGGTVEGLLSAYEGYIQSALEDYKIEDVLYVEAEAGEVYVDYWGGGEQILYIMEFDEEGKATGRWGEVSVNLPEIDGGDDEDEVLDVELQIVDDWKIEYAGVWSEDYYDEIYDDEYFTISGTGDTYYSICINDVNASDDEILEMMQGDMEFYQFYASFGFSYEDLLFQGEGLVDSYYGAKEGTFDAYIVGYDVETGKPTGQYAVTTFTSTGISQGDINDAVAAPARTKARSSADFQVRIPHRNVGSVPVRSAVRTVSGLPVRALNLNRAGR